MNVPNASLLFWYKFYFDYLQGSRTLYGAPGKEPARTIYNPEPPFQLPATLSGNNVDLVSLTRGKDIGSSFQPTTTFISENTYTISRVVNGQNTTRLSTQTVTRSAGVYAEIDLAVTKVIDAGFTA